MASSVINPPVGGYAQGIVNHDIQREQFERSIAVTRDRDLTIGNGRLLTLKGPFVVKHTTPPVIVDANTLNYTVPLNRTMMVRMSASVAASLQGITARQSEMLCLINVGPSTITLVHNSSTCKTVNKIITSSALDVVLASRDSAELYYDSVSEIWRVLRP